MSQIVISQKVKRTCDGCGVEKEFEMVNITEETFLEMSEWYSVIREVLDPNEGRIVKVLVQACTLACVPAAAVKLAMPAQPVADNIDLASLRAN